MKIKIIKFISSLCALVALLVLLSQKISILPPLGKILDPFTGLIQNEKDLSSITSPRTITQMGLTDSVLVFFDKRQVPHIYAKNREDLFFAQGYMTAYFRLWQMDFMTYTSAGRLSEIFKDGFLDHDRNQRRIGVLDAANSSLKMMEKDPETNAIITAYSKGVNAYIKQLKYKEIPLEYKLLDYEPEPWSNLKTVLIIKYMANLLTGHDEDINMTNLMLALGEKGFNKYFPDFTSHITPMENDSASGINPALCYITKPEYLDNSFLVSSSSVSGDSYNPRLGSNSWVVSGKKTKSGFPILCSDPHLGLSFPAVWLEMQLSAPGMNVYGVSIPGVPAIVIGFNEDISWGITNGSDDVKDWYKLRLSEDHKKYELDGKWLPLDFTVEEIKRRGHKTFYDTVYHTIQGPIVCDKKFPISRDLMNHALKWSLHTPSNEVLTFIKLNVAKNYNDYKDAIKHYSCPTQNFTFACKDNTIAVHHQGNMAVKWPGQGKFVLDGTNSSHLYTKYIPEDSLPHVVNPRCNYVLSANQHPTNTSYPYYYNGGYIENRANRIKQLLEKENKFDIAKMMAMQMDNTSSFAVEALPVLLGKTDRHKLKEGELRALESLSSWNGDYSFTDENARLYNLWWENIKKGTWDEFGAFSFYSRTPDDRILLDLIRDEPDNIYFDQRATAGKENANDIVLEGFIKAFAGYNALRKQGSVKWGEQHKVAIKHMLSLDIFSRKDLPSAGCSDAINAVSNSWGPSWRMIVELGERPRAFGVYPGGQSGNAGSFYYDNFVNDWNKGKYYPLTFYMTMNEARAQEKNSWTLKGNQ